MRYLDTLKRLNEEIATLNGHLAYLTDDQESFIVKSQEYVFKCNKWDVYNPYDIATENVVLKVKNDIVAINSKLVELKKVRDDLIDFILRITSIPTIDAIKLMARFGIYLKEEIVGSKHYLVPQDLCIIRSGANSVISFSELAAMLKEIYSVKEKEGKIVMGEPFNVVPYYTRRSNFDKNDKTMVPTNVVDYELRVNTIVKFLKKLFKVPEVEVRPVPTVKEKSNIKISVNSDIPVLASGAEVTVNGGLQIYKRDGDNIVFNEEILNLLPYDVLAFFDYYFDRLLENASLNVMDACNEYLKQVPIGGLSYDDPAMKDSYRKRARN